MNCPEQVQTRKWIEEINPNALNIWREAMNQLRQLHGDVWNGVRFFLTVNGIIIAAVGALTNSILETPVDNQMDIRKVLVLALCILGILLTRVGTQILISHRTHYLNMLLRKTLLEINLGFWNTTLQKKSLAFPWYVESQYHQELQSNPDEWVKKQMFRSTSITQRLHTTYKTVHFIYIAIFACVTYWILWQLS